MTAIAALALPADHPLGSAPHTLLTPHLADPHIGDVPGTPYELSCREVVEDVAARSAGEPTRVIAAAR